MALVVLLRMLSVILVGVWSVVPVLWLVVRVDRCRAIVEPAHHSHRHLGVLLVHYSSVLSIGVS